MRFVVLSRYIFCYLAFNTTVTEHLQCTFECFKLSFLSTCVLYNFYFKINHLFALNCLLILMFVKLKNKLISIIIFQKKFLQGRRLLPLDCQQAIIGDALLARYYSKDWTLKYSSLINLIQLKLRRKKWWADSRCRQVFSLCKREFQGGNDAWERFISFVSISANKKAKELRQVGKRCALYDVPLKY